VSDYLNDVTALEKISLLPENFARWFAARGWTPRPHQLGLLATAQAGRSALLIAPTGGGKTLAGFLPSLVELSEASLRKAAPAERRRLVSTGSSLRRDGGLHTLYISPLKALAVDIARNLETPAPAPRSAGDFADDAGTIGAAARLRRCAVSVRLAAPRHSR
jgi:ATP-dependent Lhr-like helicase